MRISDWSSDVCSSDLKGIDMAGKPITNVAAGVNETDAVNVGQLQQAAGNLQNQVNNLSSDLRRQDKRLSGGVAAAMATAALPKAYLPGKTMMSMAGGTWNSEDRKSTRLNSSH